MAEFSNPFLRGMLGAQEAAQRSGANQIQALGGMLSIQNEMEMKPLQRQQLMIAIQSAKDKQDALRRLGGGVQGQQAGALAAGAAQGDIGPTVTNAQRIPSVSDADYIAALTAGIDPKTITAMRDISAPKMEVSRGYAYDPRRQPAGFMPGMDISQNGQAVGIVPSPNGGLPSVSALPGSVPTFSAFRNADEQAKAANDLVIVPSTAPNQPPRYASRASLLPGAQGAAIPQAQPQAIPGGMTIPPAVQAGRDQEAGALRAVGRGPEAVAADIAELEAALKQPKLGGTQKRILQTELNLLRGGQNPGQPAPNAAGMAPETTAAQTASAAAQTETARERAKTGVEFENAVLQKGQTARTNLTQLQILAPNLEKLPTGPIYPMLVNGASYFKQFGIDVGQISKDLGPAQATDAVLKQFALKLRDPAGGGGMPGALSNSDREFLVNMLPGLNKVPDGNRQLIQILSTLEQRKVDEASIVSRMQKDNKSSMEIRDALNQFAESRPVFQR